MHKLVERVQNEGQVLSGGLIKVDGFVNHEIDPDLMDTCGREFATLFADCRPTMVLTVESAGIAPAMATARHLGVRMVFARTKKPATLPDNSYITHAPSHTKGTMVPLVVSPERMGPDDRVLIIDDFLGTGATIIGLQRLIELAGATLVGVGALIEKSYENGREALQTDGVKIRSLVCIRDIVKGQMVVDNCATCE